MHSTRRARRVVATLAAGVGMVSLLAAPASATPHAPAAGTASTGLRAYLVITAPGESIAARTAVAEHGGSVVAIHDAIGVLVAHAADADFRRRVLAEPGIQQVGATRTSDVPAEAANPAVPDAPVQVVPTDPETVRGSSRRIGADRAWDVNPGSPSVTVGILDTGVDDQHHDLRANFDAAKSASCAYGKLDRRPGAWRDIWIHGTHVAGGVAAARNGVGAVGVAPNVRIASVRVAELPSGLYFPENTICGLMFAADNGIDITNNSYYTDPWQFNCPDNADQAAILTGINRTVVYAESRGTLSVAAAGNAGTDLANKTHDNSSPDDSTPVRRPVDNSCLSLPAESPGVVTVTSVNPDDERSPWANYGMDKISVAAPGEEIYSTVPGGGYETHIGTSLAAPQVAGVAALLLSEHPDAAPADLRRMLANQADDLACSGAGCSGTPDRNSFFGEGVVDACEAVGCEATTGSALRRR